LRALIAKGDRQATTGPCLQDGISFGPSGRRTLDPAAEKKPREEAMGACGKFAAACMLGVCLGVLGSLPPGAADAAELVVLTNQGATPGVQELATAFTRASGHKVTVIQETGPSLDQRLKSNGPADLITSNPEQIDGLIKRDAVVASSVTPFVLASLGVSVRAGAPKPDIGTVEAYKAALLAAKSIGYSRGCSGTNAAEGIEKLGLTEQLKSRTVRTDGGPVVEYLAKGDFEIGIQQTNIMVGAPGTDYVGVPPGFLNKPCPSSVALMAGSKEQDAARALIKFMISPEAAPLLRKTHVEPAKS
jgi:molybdate transport system substrate-binding protein